ncbi:MAG: gliding motility-associated C-terminal domain-containing protein [Flavobacteriales bacterium]|nr:gliding motility-associated C-terminal domain-containing protein [Flavobacteriales bacterium]
MKFFSQLTVVLSIFMLGFVAPKAHATHVMGADITYKCIDTLKFKFVVKMYRDCRGVPLSNISSLTRVRCASGGSAQSVSMTLTGIRDVTPVCASAGNPCNPKNTWGTGEGIEEHTFEVTIDFNKTPYSNLKNCCEVIFETGQCCRNSSINTGASNANFYTFAMINLCKAPCNSSPALTTEPIAFLCCNSPFFYNNGASDTANFDSLSYSFIDPLSGWNQKINYSGNYSYKTPFKAYDPTGRGTVNPNANPPIGIYLDPETGDLIFTPVKCDEITVAVLEVREWRKNKSGKYELIGITRRDMQFWTKTCPDNNPPEIKGPYSYSVCEGSNLCFNITTDDKVFVPPPPLPKPDPDTVTIKWNRGIPGATFTVVNPTARLQTGRFCWTPPVGSASDLPYSFTVTARDDACPLNAVTVRSFQVLVKPKAQTERKITKLPCGRYAIESEIFPNFKNPPRYQWQLLDKDQKILFSRSQGYIESTGSFLSTKQKDTILFRKGGTYIIQHTINNAPNCPTNYYDTIKVPDLLEVDVNFGPDTFVCAGTTLRLQPRIKNGAPPVKYKWGTGDTTDYLDVTVPSWNPDTSFYVEIIDGNGCTAWDSSYVFLRENPIVKIGPDRRICDYDSILLVPIDSLAYWDDPRDTSEYRVRQGDTLYKEWYHNGVLTSTDTILKTSIAGEYIITVRDSLGCAASDTMILRVNDHVEANAGPNQTICWDDVLTLVAKGLDTVNNAKTGTYRWWNYTTPPDKDMGTRDTQQFNLRVSSDYRLGLWVTEDTTTCFDDDSVSVKVNPLPILTMPANKTICCDAGVVNLRLDEKPAGGFWSCVQNPTYVTSGYLFQTQLACATNRTVNWVTYTYVDPSTACISRDSFTITVNPLPRVQLRDGYFCQDKEIVNLGDEIVIAPGNLNLGTQTWNCLDCKSYDFSKILFDLRGGVGFPEYVLRIDENNMPLNGKTADTIVIELVYRSGDGCYNRDTATIAITLVPKISFSPFRELCWDEGEVDLKVMSNVYPPDGHWAPYDTTIPGYLRYSNIVGAFRGDDVTGDTVNTFQTPSSGGRIYMRYTHTRSGCPTFRDTTLVINPLPKPNIDESVLDLGYPAPPYLFCETNPDINMLATPAGGTWSSPHAGAVVGNRFRPTASPPGSPFFIKYNFVDTKGCRGVDSVAVLIEALPEIDIITPDTQFCRTNSMSVQVEATYSNTTGISWLPLTGGTVDNANAKSVRFSFNTNNDSTNRRLLYVQTEPGNACPFVDDLFTVTVHPIPNATIASDDYDGCNPVTANFTTVFNNKIDAATAQYAWDFGDGGNDNVQNPSYVFTQNGPNAVSLQVTSDKGCDTSLNLNIDVYPIPVADFLPNPNNSTTAALPRFTFNNQSTVENTLNASIQTNFWDFGDPLDTEDTSWQQSPTFFYPADTGMYFVTLWVETVHGCRDSITKNVIIGPDILVFIPNAFSPDGGGPLANDGFRAKVNDGVRDYHMIIFNRWGEILWESKDPNEKWDGTYKGQPVQPGVYAYHLDVVSWAGDPYQYSGTVTLLK